VLSNLTAITEILPQGYLLTRFSRTQAAEKSIRQDLSDIARLSLQQYYNQLPGQTIHLGQVSYSPPNSVPLNDKADFFKYAFLDGRRIYASGHSRHSSLGSSLIKYMHLVKQKPCCGLVTSIFTHQQSGQTTLFAQVSWMQYEWISPLKDHIWDNMYIICFITLYSNSYCLEQS
jgi:hypothetical protein